MITTERVTVYGYGTPEFKKRRNAVYADLLRPTYVLHMYIRTISDAQGRGVKGSEAPPKKNLVF